METLNGKFDKAGGVTRLVLLKGQMPHAAAKAVGLTLEEAFQLMEEYTAFGEMVFRRVGGALKGVPAPLGQCLRALCDYYELVFGVPPTEYEESATMEEPAVVVLDVTG